MRAILLAICVLTIAGCGTLSRIILPGGDTPEVPTCVARYVPLGPDVSLGLDDCENYWVRDDVTNECMILDQGAMIPIPCPAEGDTLGDGR